MRRRLVSLACTLIMLFYSAASAQTFQPGDSIEAVFTVTENPHSAVAATVKLEYDASCLEWTPSVSFSSPAQTAILLDLDGIKVGSKVSASFKVLTDRPAVIRLNVQSAVDINENPVSGLQISDFSYRLGYTMPGFVMTKTEMEIAANDIFSSILTWSSAADVPYQHFSEFPLKMSFDFTQPDKFKEAVNGTGTSFYIAYSSSNNQRQITDAGLLPNGYDYKYELSGSGNRSEYSIHYELSDSYIRFRTSSDSDTIVVLIHCGNFSRRLYYSKSDLTLQYFS